jgi:hypothetical protein
VRIIHWETFNNNRAILVSDICRKMHRCEFSYCRLGYFISVQPTFSLFACRTSMAEGNNVEPDMSLLSLQTV